MTSPTINKIEGVYVGEFGEPITVTIVDRENRAVDLSVYDGDKVVRLRRPDKRSVVSADVTFVTDGADGIITFAFADGDINVEGDWTGQFTFEDLLAARLSRSRVFAMPVGEAIPAP